MNIFFYWDDLGNLPNAYKNNLNVAKALHQNHHVKIITKDDIAHYSKRLTEETNIKINLSEIIIPAAISDIVRLIALYLEGGWYLDLDLQIKRNLESMCNDKDFVLFNRKDKFDGYWLTNMVMFFKPNHPLLLDILRFIEYCLNNNVLMYDVWSCTGPGALTAFINNHNIDENNTLPFDKYFTGTGRTFRSIDSQTGSSWKYQQAFGIKSGLDYNQYALPKDEANCDRLIGFLRNDEKKLKHCLKTHGSVFIKNKNFKNFLSNVLSDDEELSKLLKSLTNKT